MHEFLIGDNPFNGTNHLSQDRGRGQVSTFEFSNTIRVALENGATGFTFSTHPKALSVLNLMKEEASSPEFGLYPVLPDAYSYAREVSQRGMLGLIRSVMGRMGTATKVNSLVRGGLGLLTSDPVELFKAYVKAELSIFLRAAPKRARLKSVLLHEIATDMIVSFKMNDLLAEYCKLVSSSFNVQPGFVTRNFPCFLGFISENEVPLDSIIVMTPFNLLGFQMNPSKEACEAALKASTPVNLIVTSLLASGYLNIEDAIRYVRSLPQGVSVAVGVSTPSHAKQTFSLLRDQAFRA